MKILVLGCWTGGWGEPWWRGISATNGWSGECECDCGDCVV